MQEGVYIGSTNGNVASCWISTGLSCPKKEPNTASSQASEAAKLTSMPIIEAQNYIKDASVKVDKDISRPTVAV